MPSASSCVSSSRSSDLDVDAGERVVAGELTVLHEQLDERFVELVRAADLARRHHRDRADDVLVGHRVGELLHGLVGRTRAGAGARHRDGEASRHGDERDDAGAEADLRRPGPGTRGRRAAARSWGPPPPP